MAYRLKLKLSRVVTSLQICRSKTTETPPMITSSIHRLSPVNPKSRDINYLTFPSPPPCTPASPVKRLPVNGCNCQSRLRCNEDYSTESSSPDKWFLGKSDADHETTTSKPNNNTKKTRYRKTRRHRRKARVMAASSSPARGSGLRRMLPCTVAGEVVKESVAVVKKSEDPYEDFKMSMLEMILEKEMFAGEELEGLLKCFLVLNSREYHEVIVDAFLEILEVLFNGCDGDDQSPIGYRDSSSTRLQ